MERYFSLRKVLTATTTFKMYGLWFHRSVVSFPQSGHGRTVHRCKSGMLCKLCSHVFSIPSCISLRLRYTKRASITSSITMCYAPWLRFLWSLTVWYIRGHLSRAVYVYVIIHLERGIYSLLYVHTQFCRVLTLLWCCSEHKYPPNVPTRTRSA